MSSTESISLTILRTVLNRMRVTLLLIIIYLRGHENNCGLLSSYMKANNPNCQHSPMLISSTLRIQHFVSMKLQKLDLHPQPHRNGMMFCQVGICNQLLAGKSSLQEADPSVYLKPGTSTLDSSPAQDHLSNLLITRYLA